MSYSIQLQVLRAKIRGFEVSGRTIATRIHKSEGVRKNQLWNQKRQLGRICRHHLVAYGLLRGIPYSELERCHPNNTLSPKLVLAILQEHPVIDRVTYRYVQWDLVKVEELLVLVKDVTKTAVACNVTSTTSTASSTTLDANKTRSMAALLASSRPIVTLKRLLVKRA